MSATALTPVAASAAGINPGMAAADLANGNSFPNQRQNQLVIVSNSDSVSHTVTVTAQQTARPADAQWGALTQGNVAVAVPAGATRVIGPFPAAFNDSSGNVQLTWSSQTGMTVGIVTLP